MRMRESTFDYAEDIISKAMMFAIAAHSGQYRKDARTPAIIHAMEAAVVASTLTSDQDVMAAALLHDTVEDTDVVSEQLQAMFGEKIADLVANETENKRREMSGESSWMIRKQESIDELRASENINVKILWLSDKLSNMRSFCRMYEQKGDEMWNEFNQKDKTKQEWYYRSVAQAVSELADTSAYREYIMLTDRVFGKEKKE
ncbi:MAG TPA: phosphohydrolase [Ruminococcaceae bacterium]|nr:phosphohydrolase [Oscillospiraceae bacterium]